MVFNGIGVKKNPLVSFVIYSYNQESFIRDAINGAFNQTYSPLEIVFSDDCSTDKTYEIIQKMAEDYVGHHTVIINKNSKNLGIGEHVNKVAGLTSGEIVVLAAGDDVSKPRRTEIIVSTWRSLGFRPAVIYSDFTPINNDSNIIKGFKESVYTGSFDINKMAFGDIRVLGATEAITKDLFDTYPRLNPNVIHEDRVFPFRALLSGGVITLIDEKLVDYRCVSGISRTVSETARDFLYKTTPKVIKRTLPDAIQRLIDIDHMGAEIVYKKENLKNYAYNFILYQVRLREVVKGRLLAPEWAVLRSIAHSSYRIRLLGFYIKRRFLWLFSLYFKYKKSCLDAAKQQKIAIFLPNIGGGGAERVAVNLANNFVQRGHAVDMVLLAAEGDFISHLCPAVNIVDLQSSRIRNAFFPLIRYLRQARPSALLACMWPLTVMAVVARALSRIPMHLVVAEHTTWSRSDLIVKPMAKRLISTSMHCLLPKADAIVSVSQGAANDLAQFANLDTNAITCIYNPIVGDTNVAAIEPDSPAEWLVGTHQKVLAVGALKKVKDYPTLLNAFELVVQRVDARLLILGEGECRADLELQVRQLGLEALVFMPGFASDVVAYFQQADLHVLSSTCEGFGNVVVEALAVGTPVVSTDCPSGPREILCDGKFGRLVPMGDATAMAAAIIESLAASHDTAALKKRAQDFSIDKASDRYLNLFY